MDLRDDAALRRAYALHGGELYGFAMRTLGDRGLAEEATQETFLRAWRSAERYDPATGSLRTWLFAIMRHVVVDALRKRSRQAVPTEELPEDASDDAHLEDLMSAWQVEEALRRLSAEHRSVLVETYYRSRPYAEVAQSLGVPEGTVKSRVFYALRSLRTVLEEMGWNHDA